MRRGAPSASARPGRRAPGQRGWRRFVGLALALVLASGEAVAAERWGWFGVRIRDLSETEMEDLAVKHGLFSAIGVVVAEVLPGTPAEGSGLRAGDLIMAIAGQPVVDTRTLQRLVGATPPGREVAVAVLRDGRRREVRIRVGEMPPDAVADRVAAEFGFMVREPSPLDVGRTGSAHAVVVAVGERTPAERAGLRVGDRILEVAGVEVPTVDAFRSQVRQVSLGERLRLAVGRQGETLTLVLPPVRSAAPVH